MIRTPQTIETRAPGDYVDGKWVDGAITPRTIMASVQPATKGDYEALESNLGGRRVSGAVRIYTGEVLNCAGKDAKNGDVLVWEGDRWMLIDVSKWRTTVLAHYRYRAVLLDEVTG